MILLTYAINLNQCKSKGGVFMSYIITIGRQYGSGGHEIGEKLAQKLNIPFYDNALIDRVAKESGLSKDIINEHDEKPTASFLYNLVMDPYSVVYSRGSSMNDIPYGQKIFLAQFNTVKNIADEGPCVIVGRCADYILKDRKDVVKIFIYADKEFRAKRILAENSDINPAKINDILDKKDRNRASYYNFYSDSKWGNASSYDLCINSSKLGIENTVKAILSYIETLEKN